ncbi:MAG: tetratricopeptide repeat protein, partial [Flavobacteriaceae bacterium]|nr:tetratricopeptide repeat protein [Flavobacteriaceae bacterium]
MIRFLLSFFTTICVYSQSTKSSSEIPLEKYEIYLDSFNSIPQPKLSHTHIGYYLKLQEILPEISADPLFFLIHNRDMGYEFYHHGFYRQAIFHYERYLEIWKNLDSANRALYGSEPIHNVYGFLADSYSNLDEYNNAREIYSEALLEIGDSDTLSLKRPFLYNEIGLFHYWRRQQADSAIVYFKRAYDYMEKFFPADKFLGSIRDNMADIYRDWGDFQKAKEFYLTNFDFYRKHPNLNLNTRGDNLRLIEAADQFIDLSIRTG